MPENKGFIGDLRGGKMAGSYNQSYVKGASAQFTAFVPVVAESKSYPIRKEPI